MQVHGLGEHSGRYAHVADWFHAKGWAFLGYDHRGHGKTGGKKGHIPKYGVLMEEIDLALARAWELYPGKKVWLYGHSWGGNMVLNYLIRKQPDISGALVTGPWLTLPPKLEPNAFLKTMAKVMNVIWPSMPNNNGLDVKGLARDPGVIRAYQSDPLVHNKITVRNFSESNQAAAYAIEQASKLVTPTYLAHGGGDFLTNPNGSKEFTQYANPAKLTFKLWEKWYHELHNEPEKEQIFAEMLQFMET